MQVPLLLRSSMSKSTQIDCIVALPGAAGMFGFSVFNAILENLRIRTNRIKIISVVKII